MAHRGTAGEPRGLSQAQYDSGTVTISAPFCAWCGEAIPRRSGPGRPARYCRRSHRQRAFEARREAERRGISPDEVLLSRFAWDRLRDALYRLEAAAQDVALDVGSGRPTKADYAEALGHLTGAVRELQEIAVEPTAMTD